MEEILLVDGYNLIGAWPKLSRLGEKDLEEAREHLISTLADYQGYSGRTIIVVFDAHLVAGQGSSFKHYGVDVRFTKEKETADECIERLVGELTGRSRRVYVATSDLTEQRVTFGKGALRLSAKELLLDMKESGMEMDKQLGSIKERPRNTLGSKLPLELRGQLEKWRRNEK